MLIREDHSPGDENADHVCRKRIQAFHATILFSLKSYGTSTHERTFEAEGAEIERSFIEAVQKLHISA
jgi:hypothetical protein